MSASRPTRSQPVSSPPRVSVGHSRVASGTRSCPDGPPRRAVVYPERLDGLLAPAGRQHLVEGLRVVARPTQKAKASCQSASTASKPDGQPSTGSAARPLFLPAGCPYLTACAISDIIDA